MAGDISGFVVTFYYITELLSAQRKAAWADIARRIAHEIKNSLTPIQLAVERLRRRYLKEINNDAETFTHPHGHDNSARRGISAGLLMNLRPLLECRRRCSKRENLVEIVHRAVFLQRTAHPEIVFEPLFPVNPGCSSTATRAWLVRR